MSGLKINLGLDDPKSIDQVKPADSIETVNPPVEHVNPPVEPPVEPVEQVEQVELKSADEPGDQIDIDGVVYNLDKDGNAVDSNGAIKYTADKIKEFEDNGNFNIDSIISQINIKPVNETGEPIVYESSVEGIIQYVADVYAVAEREAIANYETELISKYPLLPKILMHLDKVGSLDNFKQTVDYGTLSLDETNVDQHKSVIVEARLRRGDTIEKANKYVKMLEDSKSTYEEAIEELQYLVAEDDKAKTEYENSIKEQQKAELEAAQEYWGVKIENGKLINLNKNNSIYDIIQKGTLKIGEDTYQIPDKIMIRDGAKIKYANRNDFFNYLYNPITVTVDGKQVRMTLHEIDLYNENLTRTPSNDLFDAYKRFVKYDTSQFIKTNLEREKIKKIKTNLNVPINRNNPPAPNKPGTDRIVIKRD